MINYFEGSTNITFLNSDGKYFTNGNLSAGIENVYQKLEKEKIIQRIWNKDFTVWRDEPDEISNRLGWLDCPDFINSNIKEINEFVKSVIGDGIKNVLLLGMGGSSLAPEMFSKVFGEKEDFPNLYVLDSTHPQAVKKYADGLNAAETLYIVSTKSGGTVETLSFMKYFFNNAASILGKENAGKHFTAITDSGSKLETLAHELNFRKIFLNDANIGGRYSALSFFGMVPAALVGVDIVDFISTAQTMIENSKMNGEENTSLTLGAILGYYAKEGKDKLTFYLSNEIEEFGAWAEQLIAESTGKDGMGILPVDLEPVAEVNHYNCDRVFVFIRLSNDKSFNLRISELKANKYPVIEIVLNNNYELGAEIFRWEMATVIAGNILNIQPFDQPNVESAKIAARSMMAEYSAQGILPDIDFQVSENGIGFSGNIYGETVAESINRFIVSNVNKTEWCVGRSYITLQAFVMPNEKEHIAFHNLRSVILQKYNVATTFGFGPCFLHSTGQLHKGDAGKGIFIQFIDEPETDLNVPDKPGSKNSSFSFGTLIKAQLLGDRKALLDNNRKVATIKIKNDLVKSINSLTEELKNI